MSHYFESPQGPAPTRLLSVEVWGARRDYEVAEGVFAGGGLDKATRILLEQSIPPPAGSTVLDLGCGWGPIACTLAAHGATVWAVDVNDRALELTARNAQGLPVTVARPEDIPADLRFDQIWSNPPIRIGKQALHDLLAAWLPRLRPGGEARLVVGKNLGADSLQRWLTGQGFPTDRVASSKGFRVLSVQST